MIYFLPLVNGKYTWKNPPSFLFELIVFGEFNLNGLSFNFKIYISVKTGILFNAKVKISLKITSKNENRFLQEEKVSMVCSQDGVAAGSISDNSKGSDYFSKFDCDSVLSENLGNDVK